MPWSGQSMYCKWVTSRDCRHTYEGRGWTNSQYHDDYILPHMRHTKREWVAVLPLHWGCALIGILCWWHWMSFPQRAWRLDTGEKCGYAFQMYLLTLQLPGNIRWECIYNVQRWHLSMCNKMCMRYNAISIVHVRLEFNLNLVLCLYLSQLYCVWPIT